MTRKLLPDQVNFALMLRAIQVFGNIQTYLCPRLSSMTPMQKVDILRAACCVAGIDGQTTEAERSVIDKLASDVGVGRASLEAMIERGLRDPNFHEQQCRVLKEDPQESMAALLEVAIANGELSDAELQVLRSLSKKLSVPAEVFDQLISSVYKMLD